jgi:hypothetical protein
MFQPSQHSDAPVVKMSRPITHNGFCRVILILLTAPMALRFTATGALLAARRIRILPMNQHA